MSSSLAMLTNNCNCTALRKATRRVSQLYDEALAFIASDGFLEAFQSPAR